MENFMMAGGIMGVSPLDSLAKMKPEINVSKDTLQGHVYIAEFRFLFKRARPFFTLQGAGQLESFRSIRPRISCFRGKGPFSLSKGHFRWKTLKSIGIFF